MHFLRKYRKTFDGFCPERIQSEKATLAGKAALPKEAAYLLFMSSEERFICLI